MRTLLKKRSEFLYLIFFSWKIQVHERKLMKLRKILFPCQWTYVWYLNTLFLFYIHIYTHIKGSVAKLAVQFSLLDQSKACMEGQPLTSMGPLANHLHLSEELATQHAVTLPSSVYTTLYMSVFLLSSTSWQALPDVFITCIKTKIWSAGFGWVIIGSL